MRGMIRLDGDTRTPRAETNSLGWDPRRVRLRQGGRMGRCLLRRICILLLTIGVVVLAQVVDMVVRTGQGAEEVGKVGGLVDEVVGTEY